MCGIRHNGKECAKWEKCWSETATADRTNGIGHEKRHIERVI